MRERRIATMHQGSILTRTANTDLCGRFVELLSECRELETPRLLLDPGGPAYLSPTHALRSALRAEHACALRAGEGLPGGPARTQGADAPGAWLV